jgi:hypothetical protein
VSGQVAPNVAIESTSTAPATGESSTTSSNFDGIAMFTVSSLQQFTNAFDDAYYLEVIEPDERTFVDKEGSGGGLVARYMGKLVDIGIDGKSALGTKGKSEECRVAFEEFEAEMSV